MPTTPRSDQQSGGDLETIADEPQEGDMAVATFGPQVLEVHTDPAATDGDASLTPRNQLVAEDVAWMACLMQTLSASLQDGGRWMQGFELE